MTWDETTKLLRGETEGHKDKKKKEPEYLQEPVTALGILIYLLQQPFKLRVIVLVLQMRTEAQRGYKWSPSRTVSAVLSFIPAPSLTCLTLSIGSSS